MEEYFTRSSDIRQQFITVSQHFPEFDLSSQIKKDERGKKIYTIKSSVSLDDWNRKFRDLAGSYEACIIPLRIDSNELFFNPYTYLMI